MHIIKGPLTYPIRTLSPLHPPHARAHEVGARVELLAADADTDAVAGARGLYGYAFPPALTPLLATDHLPTIVFCAEAPVLGRERGGKTVGCVSKPAVLLVSGAIAAEGRAARSGFDAVSSVPPAPYRRCVLARVSLGGSEVRGDHEGPILGAVSLLPPVGSLMSATEEPNEPPMAAAAFKARARFLVWTRRAAYELVQPRAPSACIRALLLQPARPAAPDALPPTIEADPSKAASPGAAVAALPRASGGGASPCPPNGSADTSSLSAMDHYDDRKCSSAAASFGSSFVGGDAACVPGGDEGIHGDESSEESVLSPKSPAGGRGGTRSKGSFDGNGFCGEMETARRADALCCALALDARALRCDAAQRCLARAAATAAAAATTPASEETCAPTAVGGAKVLTTVVVGGLPRVHYPGRGNRRRGHGLRHRAFHARVATLAATALNRAGARAAALFAAGGAPPLAAARALARAGCHAACVAVCAAALGDALPLPSPLLLSHSDERDCIGQGLPAADGAITVPPPPAARRALASLLLRAYVALRASSAGVARPRRGGVSGITFSGEAVGTAGVGGADGASIRECGLSVTARAAPRKAADAARPALLALLTSPPRGFDARAAVRVLARARLPYLCLRAGLIAAGPSWVASPMRGLKNLRHGGGLASASFDSFDSGVGLGGCDPEAEYRRRLSAFYATHNRGKSAEDVAATVHYYVGQGGNPAVRRRRTISGLDQVRCESDLWAAMHSCVDGAVAKLGRHHHYIMCVLLTFCPWIGVCRPTAAEQQPPRGLWRGP